MSLRQVVPARSDDLDTYIELMEEVADWLEKRGVRQWSPGIFRSCSDFYREPKKLEEVHLVFLGNELAGGSSAPVNRSDRMAGRSR